MLFHVDPGQPLPIYRQLADQVTLALARGALRPGDQLPSVRSLSETLAVNPATVQKAWQELERDGIAENRRGLGMFVAAPAGPAERAGARRKIQESASRLAAEALALGLDPEEVSNIVTGCMYTLRSQAMKRRSQ